MPDTTTDGNTTRESGAEPEPGQNADPIQSPEPEAANALRRRLLKVTAVLIVVAVIGAWAFWPSSQERLEQALATAFSRPVDLIELNLPPASGRYPGAVLLRKSPRDLLLYRSASRPSPTDHTTVELKAKLTGKSKASVLSSALGSAESKGQFEVVLHLKDLRTFELDNLGEAVQKSLLEDEKLTKNAKAWSPSIVVRAYEAILVIELRRSGESRAGTADWEKAKKQAIQAQAELQRDGSLKFESKSPVVLAYETMDIEFFSGTASPSPNQVKFTQHVPKETEVSLRAVPATPGQATVLFATAGNSSYENRAVGSLPMVAPSLDLVATRLRAMGASAASDPLMDGSCAQLSAHLKGVVQHAKIMKPDLLVYYFVGHAVSRKGGQQCLLLNDYSGDLNEAVRDDLSPGINRQLLEQPTNPASAGNLGSLLKAMNAIQSHSSVPEAGFFPVAEIYRELSLAGVPFAIVVDGCYPNSQFEDLKRDLQLTTAGDHVGPTAGEGALLAFSKRLREFAAATHLRSTNVVLFAALPGTLARAVPDPRGVLLPNRPDTERVGPLAARLERSLGPGVKTWGDVLRRMCDVQRLGQVDTSGTASFSDFAGVNRLRL